MNLLIVYAHPNHESLNYAFYNKVIEGIDANDKEITVKTLDLYKENFNPVLVHNQDRRRRDMATDVELEIHRKQLLWANKIVFIYPIWWGRPPAMLLGYFDRLLASGFAYKNNEKKIMPEGLLANKDVICISTMKGPNNYIRLFLNNMHQVMMKKAVFSFVGIKKVKFFEFGSTEKKNGKQSKYLAKVKNHFEYI